jgi:hypothetical protein
MIKKSNYFNQVNNIDYKALPEALKEGFDTIKFGSKEYTTWEYLDDDKGFLDVYFKKLNELLDKKKPSTPTKLKSKVSVTPHNNSTKKETPIKKTLVAQAKIELVERIPDEIRFIKRFVLLNGRIKTKHQILLFINGLQRAITEKRIRKTSKYAKQVIHIQDQLVNLYNEMPEQIKVEIDAKIFDNYSLIANSEKSLLSITYIKRFISLHGKTDVKVKAKRLADQMKAAAEKSKLTPNGPYKKKLDAVYNSLMHYINGKTKAPEITTAELNGLMGMIEGNSLFSKKKAQTDNNLAGIQGVISSVQLSEMQFDTIGLTGKYKDLIGDPSVGFSCMVYGKPKSGKSTMCIDFAKHLAENHGKVLYVAIEEGYGYTMKEKLERLGAVHPNLFVSENIPEDLSSFSFVFIDSVSKGKVDNEKINQLIKSHPKTAFLFIFHSTKEGDFRGGQENAHDVDCIIEVKDGVASGKGRFGVGGEISVF